MKSKFLSVLMFLILLAGVSFAGQRAYQGTGFLTSGTLETRVATSELPDIESEVRLFHVYNPAGARNTVSASVECSILPTTQFKHYAMISTAIGTADSAYVVITNAPYPYWRVRVMTTGAGLAGAIATPEVTYFGDSY
jgi:hypothetical protein